MPVIRSLLFFPADSERFLNKAPSVPADALILDLQASVPEAKKDAARDTIFSAIKFLRRECDKTIFVRINPRSLDDAAACVAAGVDAVVVPTVDTGEDLLSLSPLLSTGDDGKSIPLFPIIETPLGLINLRAILDTGINFGGVMFGVEDFVLGLGPLAQPCQDSLFHAAYTVAVTARAYDLPPYGITDSLALVRDLDQFAAACRQARSIGMVGCPAVHPKQVDVVNREFSPSEDEIQMAKKAVTAFEEAGGIPILVAGRMIDEPIYIRYRQMLDDY